MKGWNKPHPQHECACHLAAIDRKIDALTAQGASLMSVTQDVLARVKAESTTLDSILALVKAFVQSGDLSPEAAAEFTAALDANAAKSAEIEAALQPAVPPPPPVV
jgi:hypothetical protein